MEKGNYKIDNVYKAPNPASGPHRHSINARLWGKWMCLLLRTLLSDGQDKFVSSQCTAARGRVQVIAEYKAVGRRLPHGDSFLGDYEGCDEFYR